jgi:hypothetical protein
MLLELQNQFSLTFALLVAMEDSESPMFYVVLDDIGQDDAVYREILRIANSQGDPNFDPFSVAVVGTDDSMAQSASKFIEKYGKFFSTHKRWQRVGRMYQPIASSV